MYNIPKIFLIACLLLLMHCKSVSQCETVKSGEKIFQYIYVDSNTGASSGGHTALVFDDTVFHFQNQNNGFFKFEKTSFKDFYNRYSELENRSIFVHDISVSKESFEKIYRRLLRIWLIQDKNFSLFAQANEQILLLNSLSRKSKKPKIRGVGFFDTRQPFKFSLPKSLLNIFSDIILYEKKLQHYINNPDFSIRKTQFENLKLSSNRYPSSLNFRIHQYISNLQTWIALQSLIQGWGLQRVAYFNPMEMLKNKPSLLKNFYLNKKEITILEKYKKELLHFIKRLIVSQNDFRGEDLLLAIARLRTIQMSIEKKHLFVLDPYSNYIVRLSRRELDKNKALSNQIQQRLLKRFNLVKSYTFSRNKIQEEQWNGFENTASFYLEFIKSNQMKRHMRVSVNRMVPGRKTELFLKNILSQKTIQLLEKQSRQNIVMAVQLKEKIEQELLRVYNYNIFTHNCATELVEHVNSSFENMQKATQNLGGKIEKNEALLFIPFVSYDIIASGWRVIQSKRYMPRRLADLKIKNKNIKLGFLSHAKESFVFTSSSYSPNSDDSAFVFFTDDAFWLRPVFGFVNLVYATAHSIGGLFIAPFDNGEEFIRGAKGAFWSFPELVFFNVRKGSYMISSYREPTIEKTCGASKK